MEKLQVTKFDGHKNFPVWKAQVRSVLEANNWFGAISGDTVKDFQQGEDQAANPEWIKADAKARAVIMNTLEAKVVRTIMNMNTAHDMWVRLEALFESKCRVSVNMLLKEFHGYKMNATEDMLTHITKVENMVQRLSDVGEYIAPSQVISKMLELPKKYGALISAWDIIEDDQQTVENLIPRLMKAEKVEAVFEEQASGSAEKDKDSVAFLAKSEKGQAVKGGRGKTKFSGRCYYCEKVGHKQDKCFKFKKDNEAKGSAGKGTDPKGRDKAYQTSEMVDVEYLFNVQTTSSNDDWLADTGAARHMCNRREWFTEYHELEQHRPILSASGHVIYGVGVGTIRIKNLVGGKYILATLTDVLHVPKVHRNLISIGVLTDRGFEALFTKEGLKVVRNNKVVAAGVRESGRLYRLRCRTVVGEHAEAHAVSGVDPQRLDVWHERFGHANYQTIQAAIHNDAVTDLQLLGGTTIPEEQRFCEACCLGKQARLPLPLSTRRATFCGELVHFDICGPMSVKTPRGCRYLALFVDDFSGYLLGYPMRQKSGIYNVVQDVITEASSAGHKLRCFKSDNAMEFKSAMMVSILRRHHIKQEFSTPYVPAENGRIERQNRTVIESARAMLTAAGLPKMLWAEASVAACYIRNRIPLKRLEWKTPKELWTGSKPSVGHLRIWGSVGYTFVENCKRDKLDDKSERRILVGYDDKSKTYRMWLPGTQDVKLSRDIRFVESVPKRVALLDVSGSSEDVDGQAGAGTEPSPEVGSAPETSVVQSRETRVQGFHKRPFRDLDVSITRSPYPKRQAAITSEERTRSVLQDESMEYEEWLGAQVHAAVDVVYATDDPPANLREALASPDAEQWEKAAQSEYSSLMSNRTWHLVEPPVGANIIRSKWVFRIKYHPNGTIDKYKARLVVKGCSQKAGVDYFETYSPVSKMMSIRSLLSIVAANDLEMVQCDVSTAFLYGELDNDVQIFMYQPEGYNDNSGRVCKLDKALYGLKQAPLQWNRRISKVLESLGLKPCVQDPCVYVRDRDSLRFGLYVDDGLCIAPKLETIEQFLGELQKTFKMTRGDANCYIGIEIERDRKARTLKIHQAAYLSKVLERFSLADCNPTGSPAALDVQLRRNIDDQGNLLEAHNVPFRSLIGSLLYAAVASRPDIAYIVNQLSQFLESPSKEHWLCAKRILRYVKGTLNTGIIYTSGEGVADRLVAYSDASWASDPETRKSVTGVCLMMNGGAIGWRSKKQTVVADSTTYSEYIAAHSCARDVVWLRGLLEGLGCKQDAPTVLFMDNTAAELLVTNPIHHERTKHVDTKFHYVRERFEKGDIKIRHVGTKDQLADIFTKVLPPNKFEDLRFRIGMK